MNTDNMIASVPLNEEDLDILMDLIKEIPEYKVTYEKIKISHTQLMFKKKCINSFEKEHKKSVVKARSTFAQTLKMFNTPNIEGDVICYDEY